MRFHSFLLLLALSCASSIQAQSAQQNATAFALLYGYPLLAFEQLAPSLLETVGVNTLAHARELRTAADRTVVKPNVDTLYSTMIFDLSQNYLQITIPDVPADQFHLFSYYDPFGDNFANTGTGNLDVAGDYLLQTTPGNGSSIYGVQNDTSSQYTASINSPATYGIFLIRWLVQNASVYDAVHSYQNATLVNTVPRITNTQIIPTLDQIQQQNITGTPAETALSLLAAFESGNPPEIASQDETVATELSLAGISNGTYTPPSGVNITQANDTALIEAAAAASAPGSFVTLGNGWSMVNPNMTGDFGANYGLRTAVASSGYLMLKAPNALYPAWSNTSGGSGGLGATQYALGADVSYLYTFSAKPPLQSTGFWSLTAYADNYLIPNDRNVYALGDRSNLTYADGSRIYGRNASTSDGPFQILVQPANLAPPSNWTDNWLPAAAGGGNMSLILRWYGATDSLTNGEYVYPVVTKQAAITSGGRNGSTPSPTPTPAPSTGGAAGWEGRSSSMLLLFVALGTLILV